MEMVEVKTGELIGDLLNCLVATIEKPGEKVFFNADGYTLRWHNKPPAYSTDWSQGGPLIEKYRIEFSINEDTYEVGASLLAWRAFGKSHRTRWSKGKSHLIAACRAIVAAKLGDTVSVPAELL